MPKEAKPGVIYFSTIPPYMKPGKLRQLMEEHGKVDRIYLVREDEAVRRKRVKFGGNRKIKYREGWVEFLSKKIAKHVAKHLNCEKVGGKGFFAEDMWNMKYLSGFTWDHLNEKLRYDQHMKQQELRMETEKSKKEQNFFLQNVEKSARMKQMAAKKQAQGKEFVVKQRNIPTIKSMSNEKSLDSKLLSKVIGVSKSDKKRQSTDDVAPTKKKSNNLN
eukprot:TRINITY_DN2133_c2_g1_i1.p1 TRINITY_DN2133_c2_g1~~TRINITY_DN2133_c2_g1_i1.p1  ORF type:complete len:218 (+),score=57.15 TRINITY_DN2133_c2_g1_i1:62-715(+)